jgi:RNA polymerase sigma-B factor
MSATDLEERELLRAWRERGDLQARDRLIELYLPLVRALARRYAGRSEQIDDLVQVGSIGLIKAIDRYELERGIKLTTYAIPTIIGELKRYFRDKGWALHVPRRLKELSLQLTRLIEELSVQEGRSPTIRELARALNVEEEEVIEALEAGQAYATLSLSQGPSSEGDEVDPFDSIGEPDPGYGTREVRTMLRPGFRALSERERTIMHLRFYAGLTQSEIAAEVGISQMHVSRMIRQSLDKMREALSPQNQSARA